MKRTFGFGGMMRQSTAGIVIRLVSAALGYGLVVALARWMDADEFGRFGFAFSLATTLSVIFDMGQRRLVMRFLAAYLGRGRQDLLHEVLRYSFVVTAFGAGFSWLAVTLGTYLFHLHPSLYPAGALTAALIFSDYLSHALRGLGDMVQSQLPREVLWRPVTLGVMAVVGGSLSLMTSATAALWWLVLILTVLVALQAAFVWRRRWADAQVRVVQEGGHDPNPEETPTSARLSWRGTTLRLWAISALNQGLNPLSVVIVGLFVAPADTGAFFVTARLAGFIAFPLQALNLMAAPRLARAYASDNRRRLQQVAAFTAVVSGMAALVGAAILILFGRELLGVMNPAFKDSHFVLLVIMSGYVVSALCGSSGYLMTMTGHDGQFLKILAVWNGLGLLALLILTAAFEGMGAAWGLFVSTAGWNLAVVIWARRHLGLDPSVLGVLAPKDKTE